MSAALIGYDGAAYTVGDRVELSPHTDLWMRALVSVWCTA